MLMPKEAVRIVEVGPRDGLQNEPTPVSVATRIALIEDLVAAGIRHIECGSFVSPKWVPQMANTTEVCQQLKRQPNTIYSTLTPNMKGLEQAIEAKVNEIAVFGAASETFSQKNINCSIAESLQRFDPVAKQAKQQGLRVRGYVSCVVGCPYEGNISPAQVAPVVQQLLDLGCDEISLGDTIGIGTPAKIKPLLDLVIPITGTGKLAVHFHNTYGQALVNIYQALNQGIRIVDSAIAGLGGCPYAKGASGNVATEDVTYLVESLGFATGLQLPKLIDISQRLCHQLGRANRSNVAQAMSVTL
ncbi:hydroxymethylglutaryl-CoA lyase [Spartinivicinus sp. A2-2]|uniref:Hydroxymethylglutaryl-CoA lyase n=2 Tax=Spartinivicinus poritis TaxID=2994640 RepID=A0ABT5U8D5_9GAMM|nr:hydroxymethylglutaryl-CoA lyase [Spartinivicinus sp. A2-2]MDE1462637.1 hydroxymethylglutaryl-CoA lyase [Spartinivicinus sp. A2-2]